jgi:lipid-binding SYLF domain-containing protein
MRTWLSVLTILALIATVSVALADEEQKEAKASEKRQEIDTVAKEALDTLLATSPNARKLYEKAHGYAVFDNLKIQFLVSGGGGAGVAVDKETDARTYMKMGTGGIGLGLGGQKYQVVFLFESKKTFDNFVDNGWKAETSAQAAAGKAGAGGASNFTDGMAVYQMSDKGLMASVDITGTKYWKNKKLND